ncbi:dynamin family protein [Desulfopila sp. IMCC35006]|uniref:dynamin family protein n=1 Tax=Desulfopila sp. IMCC35006 TaxID=2569542 RepID=UPI0010AC1E02|nr:dynamin family protein [Desulfopila sp. IMCC35006]TKB25760.1 dynamin family protein [Desulfopila sp. IMCC35006]
MNEKELQKQLQTKVKKKLEPLFARYKMDFGGIDAALKWKPIVLIIGNYSSGKSTLINELVGQHIQRTGQAPTDDSFTIITSDPGINNVETPGSTLVNDERLPFQHFRGFGEKLISHICMKQVVSPVLENMAIIDSPGMIDATSENDRGYDYMKVLGEFAKIADLIVLMFDSHKTGTIKESYDTIRHTLPEKSGEHRIVFVMSRIDECDSLSDFTRSYGTLCWNMSQMTGRKDIPHIYLTYAPSAVDPNTVAEGWPQERDELIEKIKRAPGFRIGHILEDIDRQVNEVQIVAEAVSEFLNRATRVFWKYAKITVSVAILLFFFGDVVLNAIFSFPDTTLITSIRNSQFSLGNLIIPCALAALTLLIGSFGYSKIAFKKQRKKAMLNGADLVLLNNDYRKNLWRKMETKVKENLQDLKVKDLWSGYGRGMAKIQYFLNNDLKKYYEKIVT